MAFILACPQGHRWVISADGDAPPAASPCPVCGSPCTVKEEEADGGQNTIAYGDQAAVDLPDIPGYLILSILGQGGMGVVYKAEQVQLHRPVALKMILAGGAASQQQLVRFQIEAEALASLQHRNIVQIFEVGRFKNCPFFALELVSGGSLAQKLGGEPVPIDAAATLIETLALAIHAAHLRGIVHRDLKPGNILLHCIDGQDDWDHLEPKITDFGLAKKLGENLEQTQTGAILGTPRYMAPEQALGEPHDIGPATDLYALGVILYELLTGAPPFAGKTVAETIERVRNQEPTSPSRLRKVPFDLEVICLKCLEKEPRKRYVSGEELARDLYRFRHQLPILARPVRWPERVAKWARRRPAVAALVAGGVLSVVVIASLVIVNEIQTSRQRDAYTQRVQKALDRVADKVVKRWADEPHKDPFLREILEETAQDYEELARGAATPHLRRDTAKVLVRLGQIYHILNRFEEARTTLGRARDLCQELHASNPHDQNAAQSLAQSLTMLGETIREEGKRPIAEAEPFYRQALDLQKELVRVAPAQADYRQDLARSHYNLGIVAMETDRTELAEQEFGAAITELETLATPSAEVRHELARSLINRGTLHKSQRRFDPAERDYGRALELYASLPPVQAIRPIVRFETSLAQQNLGNLQTSQNRFKDAEVALNRSRELLEALVRDFPDRASYKIKLATSYTNLGTTCALARDFLRAEEHWKSAGEHLSKLTRAHPTNMHFEYELALVYGNLGWLNEQKKNYHASAENVEQALRCLRACIQADADNATYRQALRNQYRSLAEIEIQRKHGLAAAEAARQMAAVFPEQNQDAYYAACFLARSMGQAPMASLKDLGDQAVAMLRRAGRAGAQLQRLDNEDAVFEPLQTRKDFLEALAALKRP